MDYAFKIILLIAGAILLAIRASEVSGSKYGLWTSAPHSGFTPETPSWK